MKKTYTFSKQEIEEIVSQSLNEVKAKTSLKFSWSIQEDKDRMDRSMGTHTVELTAEFNEPMQKPLVGAGD